MVLRCRHNDELRCGFVDTVTSADDIIHNPTTACSIFSNFQDNGVKVSCDDIKNSKLIKMYNANATCL